MLFDKRVLHSDTLAKYAAFFRMSRSSVVLLSSSLSLVISACRALTSSIGFSSDPLSFRVQVYSRPTGTPERLATSVAEWPESCARIRLLHSEGIGHISIITVSPLGLLQIDLLQQFVTQEPDEVWVTDISYIRTLQGWLYLAVVLDLFSRQVIG